MELLAIAGLLWAISKALITASWAALKAPMIGPRGGATATKHIVAMAVRTFFETVTIDQFRYAYSPETSARLLEAWARRTNTTLKTVKLPDGTTAFWLGNPDAERLLLHLPGGAY
ncbi:uncharacterized protein BO88DRAFT_451958 [Aspergillus vadensis CBS 113365]|uniref:Uncharacterized protein n=1 Tax=Aspergillus vadensis (strain CBS 113365 / IMI 142717 / IBT 24658) TaxID=1448311 RepID=A0A319BZC9_ASPVC|nr:hypothetical protein BO88DRAFT_451958 [Aspergillus vadensis CBS 113365]PYH71283.1 hypothetical protein BO88DRAFT_451958 [Aspergillus vadensis CBS 113365]